MARPTSVDPIAVQVGCAALRHAFQVDTTERWTDILDMCAGHCRPAHLRAWAQYHGVVSSVYRALAASEHAGAAPLQQALALLSQTVAAAGLLQAEALTEILSALSRHSIDVMPLKGIHLDVRAYGGPGQRKDGDHDLLVRPDQIIGAVEVLREVGYKPADPARPVSTWRDTVLIHHGPPLVKRSGSMPSWVELHWHIAPATEGLGLRDPARLTEMMWRRSRPATLCGVPIREMDPADEVVHLALHAIRHMAQHTRGLSLRFSMIEDLYRRIQSLPDLDGAVLQRRMGRLGEVDVQGPLNYVWTELLGTCNTQLWPEATLSEGVSREEMSREKICRERVPLPWPRRAWEQWLLPRGFLQGAPHPEGASRRRWHREKACGLLVHALLLPRWKSRAALIAQDLLQPLLHVNDKDRAVAPAPLAALPDMLLLPVRWARLLLRVLFG